jgi:hypothetical protein
MTDLQKMLEKKMSDSGASLVDRVAECFHMASTKEVEWAIAMVLREVRDWPDEVGWTLRAGIEAFADAHGIKL